MIIYNIVMQKILFRRLCCDVFIKPNVFMSQWRNKICLEVDWFFDWIGNNAGDFYFIRGFLNIIWEIFFCILNFCFWHVQMNDKRRNCWFYFSTYLTKTFIVIFLMHVLWMFKLMVLFFNIYLAKSEWLVQSSIGGVDKQFLIYINAYPIIHNNALHPYV